MTQAKLIKTINKLRDGKESGDYIRIELTDLNRCEEMLDLKFSNQQRTYYLEFGSIYINNYEIFGIHPYIGKHKKQQLIEVDLGERILGLTVSKRESNVLEFILNDRKNSDFPKVWVPITCDKNGLIACTDYDNLNELNEPRVILVKYTGTKYEIVSVEANSLVDYFKKLYSEKSIIRYLVANNKFK